MKFNWAAGLVMSLWLYCFMSVTVLQPASTTTHRAFKPRGGHNGGKMEQRHPRSLGWIKYNGICVPSGEEEGVYLDSRADVVSVSQCIDLCRADEACVAATVSTASWTCRLASTCTLQLPAEGEATYVAPVISSAHRSLKSLSNDANRASANANASTSTAEPSSCSMCSEGGPCREPTVCRYGRCFKGPSHPDGAKCGAGAPGGAGVCEAGTCITIEGSEVVVDKPSAAGPTHSAALAGFTVQEAQRCVRHSHIYIAIDVGECASRCRSLAECAAFSFGKEQCLLFTQANCSMNAKGWLSGVKLTKAEAR